MERYIHSFGGSLAVAALVTAFLFAVKAAFPGLEAWSEETFGHAWLSMGLLALFLFLGLGLAPFRWTSSSRGLTALVVGATIISSLVITAIAAAMAALE